MARAQKLQIRQTPVQSTPASGTRSGAILGAASIASIVVNYVFLLAAGRLLGSEQYGSLAALFGVLAVVVIPASALQMAVSREISRMTASGHAAQTASFARAAIRLALLATVPLIVGAWALAVPLAHLLHIHSVGVVVLAETTFVTALIFPVALGVLQGMQRFHALAAMYLAPLVLRLLIFAVVAALGYRLGGAVFASVVATITGTLLALFLIRGTLGTRHETGRAPLRPFLRYLGGVALGLVGIALLTHLDILVVKARLSGADAGAYAAASAFARVGFFLPATILAVLFPRTAARQARGEETADILGRSLLATAAFCGALAVFYAAAGVGLIVMSFGPEFARGGNVLAPFAVAIGLFSLANILVGYHLSRGETRYAWIVASAVIIQVVALTLVPATLHAVVWTNVAIGVGLLVAHELAVGSTVPALKAGARHLDAFAGRARAVLPEIAGAFLLTTAFVCALFWRVVSHMGSTVIGAEGSDSTGTVAWLWQLNRESGFHLLGTMHHTATGAPFGWDEGNGLNLQWFLPYYPGYLAAKLFGPVVALNLIVLSGYVLSGVAMYLVTRYLGCSRLVSAWAALAFIVFPWHLARAEHASLVHIEVLALLLLALVAMAKRPSWIGVGLVGLATMACWLTSGYYGSMAVITTAAFTVGAAAVTKAPRRLLLALAPSAAAFTATTFVAIGSIVSGTGRGAGFGREVGDLSIFGIRPSELFVPPNGNIVLGNQLAAFHASRLHGSNPTEVTNYLGLLTIALAVGWLILVLRHRRGVGEAKLRATAGLVVAFAVALLFAAPSPLLFFGHQIVMPSRLLFAVTPAFRVTSRWDPLLMAVLVPLAALALQSLYRRAKYMFPRGGVVAAALVLVAMVFSFLELAIKPVPHFRTTPVPAAYAAVERTRPGILAEYPLGYSDIYRLWQQAHGRSTLNGAPAGSTADNARLVLLDPADRGTAQKLALLGVTSIAIHPAAHVDTEVAPREPKAGSGFRNVARLATGETVWKVVAAPAPALVTLPGGFAAPRRLGNGFVGYALDSAAGVGELAITSKRASVVQISFDVQAPDGRVRTLRLADEHNEQKFTVRQSGHVSAIVAIPRGVSRLLVKIDPPPASSSDAVLVSAPLTEVTGGAPALRAQRLSPSPGF